MYLADHAGQGRSETDLDQEDHAGADDFLPRLGQEGSMIIYGLKNCETCRNAKKALGTADFVDVRDQPVPGSVLSKALDRFGAALVNSRSTTWRGLSPDEQVREPLDLLATYPALMKRPLIVSEDGTLLLGWTPQTRAALGVG